MKSKIAWIFAVVLILVLVLAVPFVLRIMRWGWYGGFIGRGEMMRDHIGFFFPFGFWGMGFGMLIPAAIFVLLVLGGVALLNSLSRPNVPYPQPPVSGGRTCPSCGKPAQADWNNCPYCGNSLG